MDKKEYLQKAARAQAHFCAQTDLGNLPTLNTFTFLSANIGHFLPMLDSSTHLQIFQHYRYHKWLNGLDVACFADRYPLRVYGWPSFRRQIALRTGIICTYHFGAYQLINYLLIHAKIPYALLVAGHVKDTWAKRYPGLLEALEQARATGKFSLLDANDRGDLRKMYALAKAGYYLLIYVDGFEGMVAGRQGAAHSVPLLGQEVLVPMGAAQLSHTMRLPIYPVLALRRSGSIALKSFAALMPDSMDDRNTYTAMVMNRLYSTLSPFLMHWPEQWSNWPYLHNLASAESPLQGQLWPTLCGSPPTEQDRYGIYGLEDRRYLLRKADMQAFPLAAEQFSTLLHSWYDTS